MPVPQVQHYFIYLSRTSLSIQEPRIKHLQKKANANKIECLLKILSFSSTKQMLQLTCLSLHQQEQHPKERFMEWCWCYVILSASILEGSSGV